jgi:GDP-D-mannose dehydratase
MGAYFTGTKQTRKTRETKMTKKALITGITGQDRSYLAEFLLEKGLRDAWVHLTNRPLDRQPIENMVNKR